MVGRGNNARLRALEDLDLEDGATEGEIRAAYRTLALKHHPDKNAGNKAAEARFVRIHAAFELLSREDAVTEDDLDYDEYVDEYEVPSAMYEVLRSALLGKDVEAELRSRGVHRPPANFGISPFPAFDRTDETEGRSRIIQQGAQMNQEQDDCTERFVRAIRRSLSEGEDLREYGVRLESYRGEASLIKKYRKGTPVSYLNFELSLTFAFDLVLGKAAAPGGVNGGHKRLRLILVVPYFGEDSEENDIAYEIRFPTKKAELLARQRDLGAVRSDLRSVITPALLRAAKTFGTPQ